MKPRLHSLARALLMTSTLLASPWLLAQQAYPTPEEAGQALVTALGTDKADAAQMKALLGPQWADYVPTEGIARKDVDYFLSAYRTRHSIQMDGDQAHLVVGEGNWTLPVPLSKSADGWHFDPKAGADEIRARRIGDNELLTLQSVLAYHDAQMEYAERDHDDDGVLEYAQHILSSDGTHDGLYWPDQGDDISPLGPLYADATPGADWHGYRFHILDGQGPSAPGGAYSYLLGEDMSRGFALVAWPAQYGDSGIMSFMISHDGQVFQKDLGADSEKIAKAMTTFDPDSSWEEVAQPQLAPVSP
ncbi:DUF2950 domain-containing protein [Pseudoxanthomonas dokdonensis]|uniref:DUF2950 domain-containing protein n=1 Tax=Pseudoxanthomonas dokdonensis TaxID=344882 RepID=A0A0R0D0P2_9GAMM|nr:DUF2950 domain-containing protein [Pseudoxanthomonas dokdonensis]KRG71943.1 hypothetical protein ABB29_00255 [Pseudoxanthomonas dokdonensis]